MSKLFPVFVCLICLCQTSAAHAERYVIDQTQSKVGASVRYTVIGKYEAAFEDFKGFIDFDEKDPLNSTVQFTIKTESIHSGIDRFDRIVCSDRLLDAEKFPELTFKGRITKYGNQWAQVQGEFDLHGVKQTRMFGFEIEGPVIDYPKDKYLKAKGQWILKRKDFDVYWHKHLDKGGVIVGNHVTIDWEVVAVKK